MVTINGVVPYFLFVLLDKPGVVHGAKLADEYGFGFLIELGGECHGSETMSMGLKRAFVCHSVMAENTNALKKSFWPAVFGHFFDDGFPAFTMDGDWPPQRLILLEHSFFCSFAGRLTS
jgi:hypothetical protein